MANIRDLKKDINFLTELVITDCLIFLDINEKKDDESVSKIIDKIIDKRNEAIENINSRNKSLSSKETKKFLNSITEDLVKTADDCFNELSDMVKK